MNQYVPQKTDIVWIDFAPQTGKEIDKRRPALVVSASAYNAKTHLVLCCPITSKIKGNPFEVKIPEELADYVKGVILTDQLKSLDWRARQVSFICKLPLKLSRKLAY